ncbi:anti-sigma factor [Alicyclobacillus ferrooxydans]|uniref:Regulator of SigK n=1 Tax=Alicyclobacillus ferrooxydans TaxID=471514 RepID=A0A0P9GNQ5_9BACL|nr:anti-sigma factor [Alicyclobacillus ferrooxydans]KPV42115.1 hypothetical protein AN477_18850 [Alicyclobacillus ferrooxydans]
MKYENCEDLDLLAYLRMRMHDDERKSVEKHLAACARCRHELRELSQAEDQLVQLLTPVMPPDELLSKTLLKAYEQRPPVNVSPISEVVSPQAYGPRRATASDKEHLLRYLVPWTLSAALLIVSVFLAGQVARDSTSLKTMQRQLAAASRAVTLQPTQVQAGATGKVVIMPTQSGIQLLVYISNVKPTTGSQVYHVWLLHHGVRQSAGVIKVNSNRVGVLQVPLTGPQTSSDTIGITLEPNAKTKIPLGPKVLGANQV